VVDETDADAAALGIVMPEPEPEHFEVWEENWTVVQMFLRCQTQWRTTMNGVLGLDYGAVAWLFKMYAVKDPRELLEDLQIMEAAAMLTINNRSS
jgi:hypothetical protein